MSTRSITVFRGFQATPEYTWSPFVNKLEFRLRLGGVAYNKAVGSPKSAPHGKIPYVILSPSQSPDEVIGDSGAIARRLIHDDILKDLNARLSAVDKAHDMAMRALLEEKLYFYQGEERWIKNYDTMRAGVLGALPYLLQLFVGMLAYRANKQTLYGQGTLRYTSEELSSFRAEIWQTIAPLLAESRRRQSKNQEAESAPFWLLGGEEPSDVDCTLFGFVTSALVCKAAPESAEVVRSLPDLMEYAMRIHRRFFPDYDMWET